MNNKINLDGKDYDLDTMSDEQKYLVSLIQEQQLKITQSKKDIDVATAANKVFIDTLKTSLTEENKMANTKVPVELSSTPGIVDNSNATAITIDSSENAAFTGTVTANAGVVVDNITIDGTEIDLSSGDLDIDVAGNIRLDADDAGEIRFLDGGTQYAAIKKDSNDAVVQSIVADGDLVLKGIDGSSVISALTLDMSDAGAAIFNNSIRIGQSTAANLFVGKNGDVVEIKAAKDGTDDIDLSFSYSSYWRYCRRSYETYFWWFC